MISGLVESVQPLATLVTKVLIHSLWQGGVIALLLAGALVLLRKGSPALRYGLSCVALSAVLVWCLVTGVYFGLEQQLSSATAAGANAVPADSVSEVIASAGAEAVSGASRGEMLGSIVHLDFWLFPVWMLGVVTLSLWHIGGWIRARKLALRDSVTVPSRWMCRFEELCEELRVSRPVRLVSSARSVIPCVVGLVKPVVLLPAAMFSGMSTSDVEMIIVHELAHVRRHDIILNMIQTIVETLLFFNPAVWWISRQIRIEREHCCDDIVVRACGDRLGYARALTNLEEMRSVRTGFAVAADGPSLLYRVRRIVGVSSEGSRPAGLGVAGVFLLVTMIGVSLGLFGGQVLAEVERDMIIEKTDAYEPHRGDIDGEWEVETDRRRVQIALRFGWKGRSGFTLSKSEFVGVIDESTRYFKLIRDAGTFHFEGKFEESDGEYWGEGDCFFRPNPDYIDAMDKLGFRLDDEEVLTLAIHDVRLDFVRGLVDLGYDNLSFDRLLEAHIHDVNPDYIRRLADLGYDNLRMSKLVEMRIHDVEPEYVEQFSKLGYKDLTASRLVEMKIHDVEPEYVERFVQLGYTDLSASRLVEMQIHDVDPEFVDELRELGYDDISTQRLVEMKIHDVDPDLIRELRAQGYDDIDPSRLIEMSIHNVTPSFINELAELGYNDIKPSRLVEMKIHNVTPRYIKDLAELGYKNIKPSRLVEMRIHNVSPDFIKRMQARGYDDLSPSDLIDMKIHGRW